MNKINAWGRAAAVVVAIACGVDLANAAEGVISSDEAAIRKAAADYLEARKRGDFDALRAHWTENGNIVDETGHKTNVRDIPRPTDAASENAIALELNVRTDSIRFVTPDVAIEDGTSEFAAGPSGIATRGRYSVVWVKRNGKWLIDSLREAAIADQPSANRLPELAWMIGKWVEEGEATALRASYRWSPSKHFIIGEIRIEPRDHPSHVVTQRIAWDAATGTIRSWNFDSDGGFSSGEWSRDGDDWVVSTSGVLPDGSRTRGRRVFQRSDDQAVLMNSLEFRIDGQPVPDLRVKLVRDPGKNRAR